MGLAVIRLSASWREIAHVGYGNLDWLLTYAADARQRVVLTVGMKALGWPEFHLPEGLVPGAPSGQRRALQYVAATVRRYRDNPALAAWQIENEPFNRSGPQARWIPRRVVRREARFVRSIDPTRPLVVTTFAHFDEGLDRASSRHQSTWKRRLGLTIPPEREALTVLRLGDILGLDVYRSIGFIDEGGRERIGHAAADQLAAVARWQRVAREQNKRLWVTEAQAEPWEARPHEVPQTVQPEDVVTLVNGLAGVGVETVLLWGSEYWLWRQDHGDPRWVEAVALGLKALA